MEPVATQGMMGERATAVTYLWGRKRSRELKGVHGRLEPAAGRDGWSQISPYLKSCQALQSRALVLTFSGDTIASVRTLCFCRKLIKGSKRNPNLLICSYFTDGCRGDHCGGRLGHLPVMLRQGVEQGPQVLQTRTRIVSV